MDETKITIKMWYDEKSKRVSYEMSNKDFKMLYGSKTQYMLSSQKVHGKQQALDNKAPSIVIGDAVSVISMPVSWLNAMLPYMSKDVSKIFSSSISKLSGIPGVLVGCVINIKQHNEGIISYDKMVGSMAINGLTFLASVGVASSIADSGTVTAKSLAPYLLLGVCALGFGADYAKGEAFGKFINDNIDWLDGVSKELFFNSGFPNTANPYNPFGEATTVPSYRDPLVLDLNNDGITMGSALDSYAQFDLDASGFKERVGWINAKDGFLARDLNGNGKIDSGRELFGEHTLLKNGKLATNGFEALSDLDSNGDGIVDTKDAMFSSLKVWKDADGDGVTDDGELLGLDELGITGINIWHEVNDKLDKNHNTETGLGSFNKRDGSKGLLKQYLLSRDTINSIPTEEDEEDYGDKINAAPNLRGMGNVYSLHRAMGADKSDELYDLVMAFGAEKDIQNRYKLLDKILAKWTGCDKVPTGSRDVFINAVYLGVLEKLLGTNFVGTAGLNPGYDAGILLTKQYEEIRRRCYGILAMQTFASDIVSAINCIYDVGKKSFSLDLSKVQELIGNLADKDLHQAGIKLADALLVADALNVQSSEIGELIAAFENSDGLLGYYANSYGKTEMTATEEILSANNSEKATALFGRQVKDIIYGGLADDVLYGGAGDDYLHGGAGNDVLMGGAGNDYMNGGQGDDTYIWGKGDGNDKIYNDLYHDYSNYGDPGNDKIVLSGLTLNDVELLQENMDISEGYANEDNLIIKIKETGETLRVLRWFSYVGDKTQVKRLIFKDGTELNQEEVSSMMKFKGTDGNDHLAASRYHGTVMDGMGGDDCLTGSEKDDKIYGGAGDDTLFGKAGNDILLGGAGNDYMNGGQGDDTYIWGKGDGNDEIYNDLYHDYSNYGDPGNDTILFQQIAQAEVEFSYSGDDLLCTFTPTNECIKIRDWQSGSFYQVNNFAFSDGVVKKENLKIG